MWSAWIRDAIVTGTDRRRAVVSRYYKYSRDPATAAPRIFDNRGNVIGLRAVRGPWDSEASADNILPAASSRHRSHSLWQKLPLVPVPMYIIHLWFPLSQDTAVTAVHGHNVILERDVPVMLISKYIITIRNSAIAVSTKENAIPSRTIQCADF